MKQGWEEKKLGDVIRVINGKSQKEVISENGAYKILGSAGNVMGYANKYLCEAGTTIIGRKGNISKPIYIEEKFWNVDTAFGLFPKCGVINKFIFYLCLTIDFVKMNRGTTIPSLVKSEIQNLSVAIPPISKQERIVSILDKAFFAIDQAKQNAEKNLKNAKELFDSYLNGIFTNKGDDWEDKPLKEIAEYFNGLTYSPKDVSNNGILVLRSSNIQNDELDFNDNVYVNLTVKDKIKVKENDILMCSRNGSKRLVGKTAKIQGLEEEMTFGTFMMIIRSDHHEMLSWFFKSINFKKQISQGENTMINQITRYMLDDIVIPMPKNKDTQIKIANHLKSLILHTKNLENIYQQKITELEELKKSILQKAFNGELK